MDVQSSIEVEDPLVIPGVLLKLLRTKTLKFWLFDVIFDHVRISTKCLIIELLHYV